MVQTLRDVKEQAERDQARIKRRGHNSVTAAELESMARLKVYAEMLTAEMYEKDRRERETREILSRS